MWTDGQEVFLTAHHLAIAMEYISGDDLSQLIDAQWQRGVRLLRCLHAAGAAALGPT